MRRRSFLTAAAGAAGVVGLSGCAPLIERLPFAGGPAEVGPLEPTEESFTAAIEACQERFVKLHDAEPEFGLLHVNHELMYLVDPGGDGAGSIPNRIQPTYTAGPGMLRGKEIEHLGFDDLLQAVGSEDGWFGSLFNLHNDFTVATGTATTFLSGTEVEPVEQFLSPEGLELLWGEARALGLGELSTFYLEETELVIDIEETTRLRRVPEPDPELGGLWGFMQMAAANPMVEPGSVDEFLGSEVVETVEGLLNQYGLGWDQVKTIAIATLEHVDARIFDKPGVHITPVSGVDVSHVPGGNVTAFLDRKLRKASGAGF